MLLDSATRLYPSAYWVFVHMATHTLLIIDDEEPVRTVVQTALEQAGYHVLTAENSAHALRLLQRSEVDLILANIFMSGMDGRELIKRLRTARSTVKIIAMSAGREEWDYLDVAKYLGAHDALHKPFSLQELLEAVSAQLRG